MRIISETADICSKKECGFCFIAESAGETGYSNSKIKDRDVGNVRISDEKGCVEIIDKFPDESWVVKKTQRR